MPDSASVFTVAGFPRPSEAVSEVLFPGPIPNKCGQRCRLSKAATPVAFGTGAVCRAHACRCTAIASASVIRQACAALCREHPREDGTDRTYTCQCPCGYGYVIIHTYIRVYVLVIDSLLHTCLRVLLTRTGSSSSCTEGFHKLPSLVSLATMKL